MAGYLFAVLVAVLLAVTTPVGTGAGVHQFDLVHPLFAHVHMINGRAMTHEQLQAQRSARPTANASRGPAFGAGSGGSAADGGVGVSPTLPAVSVSLVFGRERLAAADATRAPTGRVEAPPDPPPTLLP